MLSPGQVTPTRMLVQATKFMIWQGPSEGVTASQGFFGRLLCLRVLCLLYQTHKGERYYGNDQKHICHDKG